MIPVRKLSTLPPTTRLRKIVRLLQGVELGLERGIAPDLSYLASCSVLVAGQTRLRASVRERARVLAACCTEGRSSTELRRAVNALRHGLLEALGEPPAEWDLLLPDALELDPSRRTRYPVEVYLEEVRSPFNVGSILRSSEAFGVQRLLLSPGTASPLHPRAQKTARGAASAVPWRYAALSSLRGRTGVVALELGGTPLDRFVFPPSGVLLVGSEELGLSPSALALARAGTVSIPMAGAKRSLNVAVAFGVVMQAWAARLSSGGA
ncbi:MAG: TrmH family RNA methyltransferase [Spirochaetales bacterium]|nr:TrmH family RNA methyltransferase [Spirochaetales bacterium]